MFANNSFASARRWVAASAALLLASIVFTYCNKAIPALADTAAATSAAPLTTDQAIAQARRTGRAAPVPGATTATDTLTANPNGSLTLTRSLVPARKRVAGEWVDLDPTLGVNPDGTVSPRITTSQVTLSGGGSAPLLNLRGPGGASLALSLPMALPAPRLDGATATYASVLPGIDLQVSVDPQGGVREVLVVRDAAAAANPALATLSFATHAKGVSVSADAAGNLTAADRSGHAVFTAPAPTMWDSTPATGPAVVDPRTGASIDVRTGQPARSSATGPGAAARTKGVPVRLASDRIDLVPDRSMLSDTATRWPVYIDPAWSTPMTGPTRGGYASVSATYGSSKYWYNTADPDSDRLQTGNADGWRARTLINFDLSRLSGATIYTASLSMSNVYSYSCNATTTNIYAPATTLTADNASWNYWFGSSPVNLGTAIDHPSFAHGYTSSGPPAGVGFDVAKGVRDAVAAGRTTQTFVLGPVNDSSTDYKKFLLSSTSFSVTYDHAPDVPASLSTSPATSCAANPPNAVGDGQVKLYAQLSDLDGGLVGAKFELWKTSDPSTILTASDPNDVYVDAGKTAEWALPETLLNTYSGGAVTSFSWQVQAYDGTFSSPWSATCAFRFDPTRTGPPTITTPGSLRMGVPATFTIAPPLSGTTPSGYLYQLNSAPPATATAGVSGNATVTITPTRFTNVLTVTSTSAGGNIGETARLVFNASPPASPYADQDLTGDGAADLLSVGGANNLPAGLWQAAGLNTGQVNPVAADIGRNGNGSAGDQSPSDFTGARVATGHFTGTALQDVLVYYPPGPKRGGIVLAGTGDGSPLPTDRQGNRYGLNVDNLTDDYGNDPIQLVNAGDSSGQGLAYPDLLATAGDTTGGYYLNYYASQDGIAMWGLAEQLSNRTPDNDMAWNDWTITTAQLATGTAMFLWKRSTGALYLWTGLSYTPGTYTLGYTGYALKTSGWNTNGNIALQAADLNSNGVADLWTVGAGSGVTAYLVTNLAGGTGTISAQTAQSLITANHAWKLDDGIDGAVATTVDSVAALNATGTAGATWHTGDLYSPDALLDGTAGALATTGPAVPTNADFSVSVWVKPTTNSGIVVSQDGTNTAGFKLYAEPSNNSWRFAMSTSDTASPVWDTAAAPTNTVRVGVWTQLTVTYKQSTATMRLHINGAFAAITKHASTWNAAGAFQIGDARTGPSSRGGYFAGQVADVQAYGSPIFGQANPGNGPYVIYNVVTGKCIDIPGYLNGTLDGPVAEYTCDTTTLDNQLFRLQADASVGGVTLYTVRNATDGLCLDLPAYGSVAVGTAVSEYTCNGTTFDNQLFSLSPRSDGSYWLVNYASGYCLDVYGFATGGNDSRLTVYYCSDTDDHHWTLD
jgi:hypothetical protein